MVAYSALPFKRPAVARRAAVADVKPTASPRHVLPLRAWKVPRFLTVIATAVRPLVLLLLLIPSAVVAQTVPVDVEGLRGGRHVGSAAPISVGPRLVAGLGYAYTEAVLAADDRHHRTLGTLAVGYAPRPYLQLALSFDGRYDLHRGEQDDGGAAFGTTLTTRHAFALRDGLSIAPQLKLRFPAAESVVRGLSAVSPELAVLMTQLLGRYELTGLAGYRFDRSTESVEVATLSRADQLGASLSRYDAALLGALFVAPIGPVVASAEWSFDIATGSGAPAAKASPMRLRLAAQMPFGRYLPGVELGVSPSARPTIERLARIEPRLWFAATLAVTFEATRAPPPRIVVPSEPVLPPAEPVSVAVRVLDVTGTPIEGASVTVGDEAASEQKRTDAQGTALVLLEEARPIAVEAEGYERYEGQISPASPEGRIVRLTRNLPEGEIQGKVRSLRGGRPLRARVVVQPLGIAVESDAEGNFKIAVPPGSYQLEISADAHERQQRPAQVERLGVTIVVVDLRRVVK